MAQHEGNSGGTGQPEAYPCSQGNIFSHSGSGVESWIRSKHDNSLQDTVGNVLSWRMDRSGFFT